VQPFIAARRGRFGREQRFDVVGHWRGLNAGGLSRQALRWPVVNVDVLALGFAEGLGHASSIWVARLRFRDETFEPAASFSICNAVRSVMTKADNTLKNAAKRAQTKSSQTT
jgi:hypothetical protein